MEFLFYSLYQTDMDTYLTYSTSYSSDPSPVHSSGVSAAHANSPLTESSADVFAQEVDNFLKFAGAEAPKYVVLSRLTNWPTFDNIMFAQSVLI